MREKQRWAAVRRALDMLAESLGMVAEYGLDPIHRPRPGTAAWPRDQPTALGAHLNSEHRHARSWTAEEFHARYRAAQDDRGVAPTYAELAEALGMSSTEIHQLVRMFGRPTDKT